MHYMLGKCETVQCRELSKIKSFYIKPSQDADKHDSNIILLYLSVHPLIIFSYINIYINIRFIIIHLSIQYLSPFQFILLYYLLAWEPSVAQSSHRSPEEFRVDGVKQALSVCIADCAKILWASASGLLKTSFIQNLKRRHLVSYLLF